MFWGNYSATIQLLSSLPTIYRDIQEFRDFYHAPLESNEQSYYYNQTNTNRFELLGTWFNDAELQALLAAQKLLSQIRTGRADHPTQTTHHQHPQSTRPPRKRCPATDTNPRYRTALQQPTTLHKNSTSTIGSTATGHQLQQSTGPTKKPVHRITTTPDTLPRQLVP